MDYQNEIIILKQYCIESANFITDSDSIEDRFSRQAYNDIINKIDGILEREQSKPQQLTEQLQQADVIGYCCSNCGKQVEPKYNKLCDKCEDDFQNSNYR